MTRRRTSASVGYARALQRQRDRREGISDARTMWAEGKVVPDRITTALNLANLYGPEVDAALGVPEPFVDEWEAGTRYPTWDNLTALSLLTGFPVGYFVRPVTVVITGLLVCESGPGARRATFADTGRARVLAYPPWAVQATVGSGP